MEHDGGECEKKNGHYSRNWQNIINQLLQKCIKKNKQEDKRLDSESENQKKKKKSTNILNAKILKTGCHH